VKVCAAVLTYRALSTGRVDLLERTLDSLDEADDVYLFDNGSDDGSAELVDEWGGVSHDRDLHTSGHGTNMCARILAGTDADICVLSDDDMFWRPGWRDTLTAWWSMAPEDVALTGCHIEPAFHWNEIEGAVRFGGVPGLVRTSTGAASWSYRAEDYETIFAPKGIPQQVQGHGDVPACDRLRQRDRRICQIDIADHIGHERSTWGNLTVQKYGWNVEPIRRALEAVPA
jgi:glycosyltransferase involved in cell wall biosynthesis